MSSHKAVLTNSPALEYNMKLTHVRNCARKPTMYSAACFQAASLMSPKVLHPTSIPVYTLMLSCRPTTFLALGSWGVRTGHNSNIAKAMRRRSFCFDAVAKIHILLCILCIHCCCFVGKSLSWHLAAGAQGQAVQQHSQGQAHARQLL